MQTLFPWGITGTITRTVLYSAWLFAKHTEHFMRKNTSQEAGSLVRCIKRSCGCKKRPRNARCSRQLPKVSSYYRNFPLLHAESAEARAYVWAAGSSRWSHLRLCGCTCAACKLSVEQPGEQRTPEHRLTTRPCLPGQCLRGSDAVPGSKAQQAVIRWRCVASKPRSKQDPVPCKMALSIPTKQFCFSEITRRKTRSPLVTRSQAGQRFPQDLLLGHNIEISIALLKPSDLNLSLCWVSNPTKLFCLI